MLATKLHGHGHPVLTREWHLDRPPADPRHRGQLLAPHRGRRSTWSTPRAFTYPAPKQAQLAAVSPVSRKRSTPPVKAAPPDSETDAARRNPRHRKRINAQAAPAILVTGQKLSWIAVTGVSTYVLASVVPGHARASPTSAATRRHPPRSPARPSATACAPRSTAAPGRHRSGDQLPRRNAATAAAESHLPPPTEPHLRAGDFRTGLERQLRGHRRQPAAQLGASRAAGFTDRHARAHFESLIAALHQAKEVRSEGLAESDGSSATPSRHRRTLADWVNIPPGSRNRCRVNAEVTASIAVADLEFRNETS